MRAKDSINITTNITTNTSITTTSPMSGFGIWYEGPLDLDWTPLALIWRIVATPACHSTLMIVVGLVPRSLPGQTYPDWLQWQSNYGADCKKDYFQSSQICLRSQSFTAWWAGDFSLKVDRGCSTLESPSTKPIFDIRVKTVGHFPPILLTPWDGFRLGGRTGLPPGYTRRRPPDD